MANNVLPDPSTPFGARTRSHLQDDRIAWLTTVGDDGTPQPNPVWFLWDGETILVYNRPDAHRLRHIRKRPQVAINFGGDGEGGDIVVIVGRAELTQGEPAAYQVPEYVARYGQRMTQIAGSPQNFSHAYPVTLRIHPTRVRGH